MDHAATWDVYGEGLPPLSDGRILLSEMMADYCKEQWGMEAFQVLRALEGFGGTAEVYSIFSTVGFLSGLFRSGEIPTFTRPFGGGDVSPLPRERWEIDNPVSRFIQSAVDPERWTDATADPTAWIFVDSAAYEAFMEKWCAAPDEPIIPDPQTETASAEIPIADVAMAKEPAPAQAAPVTVTTATAAARPRSIIRLPEVLARSKLSRSEIYRRMERGTFPQSFKLGANMTGWYEDEIDEWVTTLRR